jgi:hypothetical protein
LKPVLEPAGLAFDPLWAKIMEIAANFRIAIPDFLE